MILWLKAGIILLMLCIVLSMAVFMFLCHRQAMQRIKENPISDYYDAVRKRDSYCELSDISSNIINVIVALEDKNFWKHSGFDTCKIIQALFVNVKYRQKKLGGSTITQ